MIKFYLETLYYKCLVFFESKDHRLQLMWYEFTFPYHALTGFTKLNTKYNRVVKVNNRFGKFFIKDTTINWIIASPAFERPDLSKLLILMEEYLNENHQNKIVFFDVGASFGKFSVAVGNHFQKYENRVKILSFEPDPESFKLLKKNIKLNNLKNVKVYDIALSSQKKRQKFYYYNNMQMIVSFPTSHPIYIATETLDNIVKEYKSSNVAFFMKLDVEGHEIEVLEGGKKFLKNASKFILLIEDSSIKQVKLKKYLLKNLQLLCKITLQNSFWANK